MLEKVILITHAASTFMWFGIILFVQLVHYPLIQRLGKSFEKQHYNYTMPWAVLLLSVELVTGVLLLWVRPVEITLIPVILGLALSVLIWIITWNICVPCHNKLKSKCEINTIRTLLHANLLRAILWLLRSAIVIWMLVLVMN